MTTFYIREEGEYHEATSAEVIQRALHLLRQRFRLGSPVLAIMRARATSFTCISPGATARYSVSCISTTATV